jgi:hypothetical protein
MVPLVEFRHGPDGTPFRLRGSEAVIDGTGRIPFHGILSRGLLERVRHTQASFASWDEYGHLLHHEAEAELQELARWRRTAAECGVLSFTQSALCVRSYVEQYVGANDHCEAWNVKEGHTSSVWRVQLQNGNAKHEFALNVARDHIAGEELERTSEMMVRIAELWPESNLAKVLDIVMIRLPDVAQPVLVTRNEWIPDSYEIHRLPAPGNELGPLVLVERFLTEESSPSHVRQILGRRLNEAECAQVNRDVDEFLERTARFAVQVDINDGDLVWSGQRAIVIAIR